MSDVQRPLPPKKDVALALLEREPSVFIHLDPRRPGVSVPKWFSGQPQLILQVGLNMPIPIPDLKVDDEGISCTLSFNRAPFWCRIPWDAIWALVSEQQRGMVWPDDVPADLAAQRDRGQTPPQRPAKKARPRLAAVESAPAEDDRAGAAETPAPQRARPLARLRSADAPPPEAPERAPATPAEGDSAAPTEPAASRPDTPDRGAGKPKRELPPYLRVIK